MGARRREIASHSEFAPNAFLIKLKESLWKRGHPQGEDGLLFSCSWAGTELGSEYVVLIFA